jgi:hypothetical protein
MKFLREDWFQKVNEAAQGNETLKTATADITLGVQQVVTDVPGGGDDIHHFLRADHGDVEIGLGDLPQPNATLTATYEVSAAMHRGELDAMAAFSSGKVIVTGDMMTLMQHQAAMAQLNVAFESVLSETEYEG